MNDAPCRGCDDRHMMCHKECDKYIAWRAKNKECLDKRRKEYGAVEYEISRAKRIRKWKEGHKL